MTNWPGLCLRYLESQVEIGTDYVGQQLEREVRSISPNLRGDIIEMIREL